MKIALLAFPIHYSHGCILQTYALYSKLKDLGHEVIIVDRQHDRQSLLRLCMSVTKRIAKRVLTSYRGAVFYKGWYPKLIMKEQQSFIDCFRKDIIEVYSSDELKGIVASGGYDAIVVGSDQTWRPRNVPNVMDYWLGYATKMKMKKIAYAPSFGVDVWEYSDEQTLACKKLATLFDGLSVREKSGVRLCKENLNVDVQHVLDPTMLWDKSFYTPIAQKSKVKTGGCQCYFLDRSPEKEAVALKISEIKGLSVNYVNTKTEDANAPLKERIAPGIEKWLAGFLYGDFVVVDSFHAMVFCIIFQKPFIVIGNVRRGMSRFESLLGELVLKDRLITDSNNIEKLVNQSIDWKNVDLMLSKHRASSIDFLKQSLTN